MLACAQQIDLMLSNSFKLLNGKRLFVRLRSLSVQALFYCILSLSRSLNFGRASSMMYYMSNIIVSTSRISKPAYVLKVA